MILSLYNAVDVREGLYYDEHTRVVVDIDLVKQITNEEFGSKCLGMCSRLQSYNMNMMEQVLLKAVCFLCPSEYPYLTFSSRFPCIDVCDYDWNHVQMSLQCCMLFACRPRHH